MTNKSAGILLYRLKNKHLEVFLAHPGGPYWSKKDAGTWSIPKGEFSEEEDPLEAAKREFQEEIGTKISGDFMELSPVKQKSGKLVYGWAIEGDIDGSQINSNKFELEWPPKSGIIKEFPEIDRADWFTIKEAEQKINPSQYALIEELRKKLNVQ